MQIEEPLVYGRKYDQKREKYTRLSIGRSEIEIGRQHRDECQRDIGIDKNIDQLEAAEKYAERE